MLSLTSLTLVELLTRAGGPLTSHSSVIHHSPSPNLVTGIAGEGGGGVVAVVGAADDCDDEEDCADGSGSGDGFDGRGSRGESEGDGNGGGGFEGDVWYPKGTSDSELISETA